MAENREIREFSVLGRFRIHEVRDDGVPYECIMRVNVEFGSGYYTLDLVDPPDGLSTSEEWTDCLARYWSNQNETKFGEFYRLCDGPRNYIGEMEVLGIQNTTL